MFENTTDRDTTAEAHAGDVARRHEADCRIRVAAGAAFLDEREPGWFKLVNADTIEQHSITRCVGAQICGGSYGLFLRRYWGGIGTPELRKTHAERIALGFIASAAFTAREREEYDPLTAAWRALVKTKQSVAKLGDV